MSLCISVVTPEGIVMASESRQTQVVSNMPRIGSDSAIKVFELTDTIFAATAGWAFLQPKGSVIQKNISSLIEDFKPTIQAGSTVETTATQLYAYFNRIYQEHITQYPQQIVPTGHDALFFIVAGYDNLKSTLGSLFPIGVPKSGVTAKAQRTTENPGPWWIGQVEVVARIMNGYDFRALNLPFIAAANQNNAAIKLLSSLQYVLSCNAMTLQDAIDFAVSMIQITTTIQKFSPGIASQPSAAGVGGPIDIAVLSRGEKIKWVKRKELHS